MRREQMITTADENSDLWVATLTPEKRAAIRELHRVKPAWNLIAIAFVAIWAVAGWTIMTFPQWTLRLGSYVLAGAAIQALTILMHEGIHGNLFRNRTLDRWIGFLLGVPAFFSSTAYQVTHTLHHRHNRTERDPDEFTNLMKNRRTLSLAFYLWGLIGMPLYLLHVHLTALLKGNRRQRLDVATEMGLMVAAYAGLALTAYTFEFLDVVVHCWLIPLIPAAVFGGVRGWAEHMMTVPGHPLTQSRTVTSNPIVRFFMCNLNYHLEHHLYPSMPWYHLPRLHALLQEDYRQAGSCIYKSYLRFLWDALRTGVHGLAPAPRVSSAGALARNR